MARPNKCRKINFMPNITYFKPRGIPMSSLEKVILTVDEFEALRLADLEAFSQEESAEKMNISRATFGRIIEQARKKVVNALVTGKAIVIEGGNYEVERLSDFHCRRCRRSWKISSNSSEKYCPNCKHEDS